MIIEIFLANCKQGGQCVWFKMNGLNQEQRNDANVYLFE
jgi:hypothetical protein